MRKIVFSTVIAIAISGCAGSANHDVLASYQASDTAMDCYQLNLELMQAQLVVEGVNRDRGDLSGADIVDGIFWFPFNLIAKQNNYQAAVTAASNRIARINRLQIQRNCPVNTYKRLLYRDTRHTQLTRLDGMYRNGRVSPAEYRALRQQILMGYTW